MVARADGVHTLNYGDQVLGVSVVAKVSCKHIFSHRIQGRQLGLGPTVGTLVVDVQYCNCFVSPWAHDSGGW